MPGSGERVEESFGGRVGRVHIAWERKVAVECPSTRGTHITWKGRGHNSRNNKT